MAIKDRLIQFVLRGKDELSPEAKKAAEALSTLSAEGDELRKSLDSAKDARGLATSLKQTQRAVEQAERAMVQGDLQVRELREALNEAPDAAGLQQSLKDAEREARRAQKQLSALTTSLGEKEQAARSAGVDTRNLSEEEKRLAAEVDRAKLAVTDNTKQLRELERQQRAAARGAAEHKSRVDATRQSMASGAKQVLGYAAAYVSLRSALRLVQSGIGLVRRGISEMFTAGSEAEDSLAQLNAALAATGGAAGHSAEQLLQMALNLRDVSNFTTEQIIDGQTRLLSYTDVVGEQFPAAMQIVIDQAQRLGISIEQSAETVGQALQSPSKAMAALGRQGFTLEKGQQDLLKRLEATGRMAEAQAIIMGMLTESYGGSAAAARMGTATGLWKSLQDQISDFFSMISSAGAFDHIKAKLEEWGDALTDLKNDGTLQGLADALSNAFVQGAEKVEEFVRSLAKVDFKTLTDDTAAWFNDFGKHIDDTRTSIQLFVAPFRTLFNGLTSGISAIGAAVTGNLGLMLRGVELAASAIPDMLGGPKIHAAVTSAREALDGMREGFVAQIEQDGQDIRNAWDVTTSHQKKGSAEAADAAKDAEREKLAAAEATAAKVEELNARFAKSAVDAAATGKAAIVDMANAMKLIDAAETVEQLEGLKDALLQAYRTGTISQEEYNNGLMLTEGRIRKLGASSATATGGINELVKSLEGFADLQTAIGNAKTDVDISKLGSAIRQMYGDGKLTADEYKQSLAALEKQKADVKKATDEQAKSERGLAGQIDLVTQALNEKKAAEQQAADEADAAAAKRAREMNAWGGYIDSVMTAAREPLAALSKQALAVFDSIKKITSVETTIDTSGIEATRSSLKALHESMGRTQMELNRGVRGPFAKWASENIAQSQKIQETYLKQKLSLQELMDRYERGATSLAGFRTQAMSLKASLDLLDDSDLGQLNSAIASAEQRMKALGDSTRSTLDGLRDELDRLRGNEEAIERRRMESRRRELQAQMAEAQAAGDGGAVRDLQQALGMLKSIESEQRLAKEEEARQKRREPTQATGPGSAAATPAQAPATIIRLETARGGSVDVTVPPGQEDQLLSILEQSGLRTI